MRFVKSVLAIGLTMAASCSIAQTGPKFDLNGNAQFGNNVSINTTTGTVASSIGSFGKVNVGSTAASANGDCLTGADGLKCQINGSLTGPLVSRVEPQQFLSSGQSLASFKSGAINAQPAFAAAIAGGKAVFVPCGTYRFDSQLPITASNTVIDGAQYGCVVIQQNFTTGSAFAIAGTSSVAIDGVTVKNIKVTMAPGVTKTSGASFSVVAGHNIRLSGVRSDGDWIGVDWRSGNNQFGYYLENFEILNHHYAAIQWDTDGTTNWVADSFVNNGVIGGGATGFLLRDASGVYASKVDICCGGNQGIIVAPPAGSSVNSLFFDAILTDETVSDGWQFQDTAGSVFDIFIQNSWGSGSQNGVGLNVNMTNLSTMTVRGFNAHTNAQSGILITKGRNILLDGVSTNDNGRNQSGLPGILVQGNATKINIANCMSGHGGYPDILGQTNYQSYGVVISGTASYVQTHNCQFFGNASGGYISNSTGGNVTQVSNLSQ